MQTYALRHKVQDLDKNFIWRYIEKDLPQLPHYYLSFASQSFPLETRMVIRFFIFFLSFLSFLSKFLMSRQTWKILLMNFVLEAE